MRIIFFYVIFLIVCRLYHILVCVHVFSSTLTLCWYVGGRMVDLVKQGLDFWIPMIKAIGPREQTGTTSLPSDSGCIMADALIRLVNILIELKARTKLCVLGLSLYVSLPLWHAVCITALSLLLWFQNNVNSPRLWVTIGSAIVILATNRIKIELLSNQGKY